METIQYGQGALPFEIPANAITTEITPYLWPGHYGEWDEAAQSFTAWSLVTPSAWRVTSDFLAPPATCLSVGATVSRLRFRSCDLPNALQEFHVEFRQSSQLSDPSPTDQLGTVQHPALQSTTHPGLQSTTHPAPLQMTHPGLQSTTHPAPLQMTHPESSLHPAPLQTKTQPVQVRAPMKGQLAAWRIHTRIHTTKT